MKKISFIGVGIMGKSMVRNLMKAGFELHIYARTKAKVEDVISEGAIFHESIGECVSECDAVITIVGFPQDVEEVYFDEGNIIQKVRSIIPILIPLFASSFKRADALAIAMEARGYRGSEGRTKYRRLLWNCRDTLSIIAILALGLILFYLKS